MKNSLEGLLLFSELGLLWLLLLLHECWWLLPGRIVEQGLLHKYQKNIYRMKHSQFEQYANLVAIRATYHDCNQFGSTFLSAWRLYIKEVWKKTHACTNKHKWKLRKTFQIICKPQITHTLMQLIKSN